MKQRGTVRMVALSGPELPRVVAQKGLAWSGADQNTDPNCDFVFLLHEMMGNHHSLQSLKDVAGQTPGPVWKCFSSTA